jgi:hypothetical protein
VILFGYSEHEVVVAHGVLALPRIVLTPADVQEECRLRRTEAGAEQVQSYCLYGTCCQPSVPTALMALGRKLVIAKDVAQVSSLLVRSAVTEVLMRCCLVGSSAVAWVGPSCT